MTAATARGPRAPLLAAAALALAVLLLYAPVRTFEFVAVDDPLMVTANPRVSGGVSLPALRWSLTAVAAYNWHPVTWWSHLADVSLFGTWAGGHHVVSAGLHALNAALLVLALHALTGALAPAVAAAALFALHPLRVESVAWVAERKDVLGGTFWLLAVLAYANWCRRRTAGRYAALLALFALGLMTKPMLVTLPLVLLLLDLWPLGRGIGPGAEPPGRLLHEKWPLFALAAATAAVTLVAQRSGAALAPLASLAPARRVANAVTAAGWYLLKLAWPSGLAMPHLMHRDGWPSPQVLAALATLVAASVLAALAARRRPYLAVGWLWYLVTLAPVSGIVQAGSQAVAERYTYLPLIGVAVALVWGCRDILRGGGRGSAPARAAAAAGLAAALALAAATALQLRSWRDSEALLGRALAVEPRNAVALTNLAVVRGGQGRWADAEPLLRAALREVPEQGLTHYDLGVALGALGRPGEAAAEFREALRRPLPPGLAAKANAAIGIVLADLGRNREAAAHLRRAVELDPGNADAAQLLRALGRDGEAAP